jgi:ribonucleoside-diphosphate reductase alpha chain
MGPRTPFSQQLHAEKYRQKGESFDDYCVRYARTTADDEAHFRKLLEGLRSQAILPAGRQQRSVGWAFQTTGFNCFCAAQIPDSMEGIMQSLKDGAMTLRSGGGCGWDFSTLRPQGEPIRGLGDGAAASGPISFMQMWHAMCNTIRSAGERRGAMMGVLRVDHPDIMQFIRAKQNTNLLTNFNISVTITDAFMEAVDNDKLFALKFGGDSFGDVRALDLWAVLMENNWDWGEPGVLFIDRINRLNPLVYCETIFTTNPCSEEPLPPDGACLLLSQNVVKYLVPKYGSKGHEIDRDRFVRDAAIAVRACDNVFEKTIFPLPGQRKEAFDKRRMGIGVTGMANALEVCGHRYASPEYLAMQDELLELQRNTAYRTSIEMARQKGAFPLFDADKYLSTPHAKNLPDDIRFGIKKWGLRNGVLMSIAPTGTISWAADNVSSGIEPPCAIEGSRKMLGKGDEERIVPFNDWAYEEHGHRCLTADQVSPQDHVKVLCAAQKWVDASISKTINVTGAKQTPAEPGTISYEEFKDVYKLAYHGGAKGCAAFNRNGKRAGIIMNKEVQDEQGSACFITEDGQKICG